MSFERRFLFSLGSVGTQSTGLFSPIETIRDKSFSQSGLFFGLVLSGLINFDIFIVNFTTSLTWSFLVQILKDQVVLDFSCPDL